MENTNTNTNTNIECKNCKKLKRTKKEKTMIESSKEIQKMDAHSLLEKYTLNGDARTDSVRVFQDFENETTTLLFKDFAIEITGRSVLVVDYYVASENVSHISERATYRQFESWFLQCTDWYRDYVQDCEYCDSLPLSIDDWANELCKKELTLWDGDEDVELSDFCC